VFIEGEISKTVLVKLTVGKSSLTQKGKMLVARKLPKFVLQIFRKSKRFTFNYFLKLEESLCSFLQILSLIVLMK